MKEQLIEVFQKLNKKIIQENINRRNTSKAVKSPTKNKQLIRLALASDSYPHLLERIIACGGDVNNFI